ncbi:MAG: hypothetical protein H6744_13785 [Deltaproteobacteria bacterium]|nr:hypothetical protein [Deltaproteobacteria bacterium]
MRRLYTAPLLPLLALLSATSVGGCKSEREVNVIWETDTAAEKAAAVATAEQSAKEQYEARLAARENQPEPELDPEEPREKFELVWRMGKDRLGSIYAERAEMIEMLKRIKLDEKAEADLVTPWITRLTEFGIGREPASMEKAPAELCKLIVEVREPAEQLITNGMSEIAKVDEQTAALDAKVDGGGTVYQREWDAVDKARARWSAPVKAGKQLLLVVKSILEEAYVLADLGPRRAQLALRDCLTPIAAKPLELDLAQEQLEKVLGRSKWYRDMR